MTEEAKSARNRSSDAVTDIKNMILALAYNETSCNGITTDKEGVRECMLVSIMRWIEVFPTRYGTVWLDVYSSDVYSSDQLMNYSQTSLQDDYGEDYERDSNRVSPVSDVLPVQSTDELTKEAAAVKGYQVGGFVRANTGQYDCNGVAVPYNCSGLLHAITGPPDNISLHVVWSCVGRDGLQPCKLGVRCEKHMKVHVSKLDTSGAHVSKHAYKGKGLCSGKYGVFV
jgi:hypothetical protein